MNTQKTCKRPGLVLNFILMYQCLIDFYNQPENHQHILATYDGCLWGEIFLHTFGVTPEDQDDPLWDVLFTKYNAMAANDCVRSELRKNESDSLQAIASQTSSLHTKVIS